jgi:hypothetical protein
MITQSSRINYALLQNRNLFLTQASGQSAQENSSGIPESPDGVPPTAKYLLAMDSQSRQNSLSDDAAGSGDGSKDADASASEDTGSQLGTAAISKSAVNSAIAADSDGLEAVKSAMQNNLSELADDPKAFHEAMEKSFGGSYDKAKAETIRQQVLKGDFSWMPDIKVVDESVLADQSGQQGAGQAFGAYSKDNDTIYISRQLLQSDPDKATQILTEEVGHGLDARLNTSDAAGDEGDIFSRLVGGEQISDAKLAELKAENDSGTIIVDGKEVEVEYGFLKKLVKKVTKPFKKAWDGIKDVGKSIWNGVKKIGKKILESELLGKIMMVAQFIPIPIVQLVARGYNLARSAYQVGMGIKHGSVGMILGGVAGVAGGAAGMGQALGASAKFVSTATKIANGARTAGAAYMAVSQKNFAAAAGLASNAFGGQNTQLGRFFGAAGNVAKGVESYKQGDILGALNSGRAAYSGLTASNASPAEAGSRSGAANATGAAADSSPRTGIMGFIDNIAGSKTYQAIKENVSTVRGIVKLVKDGDIQGASQAFLKNYADDLGIDVDTQADINKWAGVIDKVSDTYDAVKDNDYSSAIGEAAGLLGIPLSENNQQRLDTVFKLRDSVLGDKYADASRQAAVLSMQSGQPQLASNFLMLANLLDGKVPTGEQVDQAA